MRSACTPPERLLEYPQLSARQGTHEYALRLESGKVHGRVLLARFAGVTDRTQAERLTGAELAITRAQLPDLPPGEHYWADLEGLRVENLAGLDLGCVKTLMETGANDVLVVTGERERLIPWLRPDVIREVDLQARLVRVDWDAEF